MTPHYELKPEAYADIAALDLTLADAMQACARQGEILAAFRLLQVHRVAPEMSAIDLVWRGQPLFGW
jgi:hypothetical protein